MESNDDILLQMNKYYWSGSSRFNCPSTHNLIQVLHENAVKSQNRPQKVFSGEALRLIRGA